MPISKKPPCPCGSGKQNEKCCLLKERGGHPQNGFLRSAKLSNFFHQNSALFISALLIAATLVVYWPVRHYEFVNYDDSRYVSENPHIRDGLTWKGIRWSVSADLLVDSRHAELWIPVTYLSHLLTFQLFGANPSAHHLVNVGLHVLNTVLLFLVLRRMSGDMWNSACVAALFGLHPLHVESVAWIVERKDVLSTLFGILTLGAYLRYTEQPAPSRYWVILLFFALGLAAKPMLVTLPFVLLLLDYWPLGRFPRVGLGLCWKRVWEKTPLFVLVAGYCIVTYLAQQRGGAMKQLPIGNRIENALVSYTSYIRKMFWPSDLAVFYPHPGDTLLLWQVAGAGLVLACITAWVIRAAPKRPYLVVGWLWYLGTLVPVIGLIQVGEQAMADRYTYIPLIGLFIMVAWGIPELVSGWRYQSALLIIAPAILLPILMISARLQVGYWHNSVTLFEQALRVTSSDNSMAHNNLGVALSDQGKLKEAAAHYAEALRINRDYADAHNNLGTIFTNQGRLKEAVVHYTKALRIKPDFAKAHYNLGKALFNQGKLKEAEVHYTEALRIKPDLAEAHTGLGITLANQGGFKEAVAHFIEALRIKPDYANAHTNLGIALAKQGRLKEAAVHHAEALRIEPNEAGLHNNLGTVYYKMGRVNEAIKEFKTALQLDPHYSAARKNFKIANRRKQRK